MPAARWPVLYCSLQCNRLIAFTGSLLSVPRREQRRKLRFPFPRRRQFFRSRYDGRRRLLHDGVLLLLALLKVLIDMLDLLLEFRRQRL